MLDTTARADVRLEESSRIANVVKVALLDCVTEIWVPPGAERHQLTNGTVLLARRPRRAPQAWLHAFFPPLPEEYRSQLQALVPNLPVEVERLLFEHGNGVCLFDNSFNLYGVRTNTERSIEAVL